MLSPKLDDESLGEIQNISVANMVYQFWDELIYFYHGGRVKVSEKAYVILKRYHVLRRSRRAKNSVIIEDFIRRNLERWLKMHPKKRPTWEEVYSWVKNQSVK